MQRRHGSRGGQTLLSSLASAAIAWAALACPSWSAALARHPLVAQESRPSAPWRRAWLYGVTAEGEGILLARGLALDSGDGGLRFFGGAPEVRASTSSGGIEASQALVGYRDFSYGATGNSTPTGEKPESKLWWNDGSWWGSLYAPEAEAYHVYRLDAARQVWVDTGTAIDDRGSSKADALWDAEVGKLYVASHIFSNIGQPAALSSKWARLYRYSYDAVLESYALDAGFPVTISRGLAEALTIARDSDGRLWATWVESNRVMVSHSMESDELWSEPFVLPVGSTATTVSSDDIAAVVAFGERLVGVMWSNQVTGATYFAVHRDDEPATAWQPEEVVLPDATCDAGACSDDHISLKAGPGGRVVAVLKTEQTAPAAPLQVVTVREPDGHWRSSIFGLVSDAHTRAILLLDEAAERVWVFATRPEPGGAIYFKSSAIDPLSFEPGPGQLFIQSATDRRINNPTSTKQSVGGTKDLVVLACDQDTLFYLHNFLDLPSVAGERSTSDPFHPPFAQTKTLP